MADGWIKIHRKVFDNELYFAEKFSRFHAFLDLVLLAYHKQGLYITRGIEIQLERGQLVIPVRNLVQRWQWSSTKVLHFLGELEQLGMIKTERSNVATIITIINYEKYQSEGETGTQIGTLKNNETGTLKKPLNTRKQRQNKGYEKTQTGTQKTGTLKMPLNTGVYEQNLFGEKTQTGTQNEGETGTLLPIYIQEIKKYPPTPKGYESFDFSYMLPSGHTYASPLSIV